MKLRGRALILALLLWAAPVVAVAAEWPDVLPLVKKSTVEIASSAGACTGFVIDNEKDLVLTAAHCDGPKDTLFADNLKAEVKAKDDKNDLMVLYVKDIDRPALKLAQRDPMVGQEVASFGWGYAMQEPLFRVAHISAKNVALERAHYVAIDASFVPGQSGGPVVDKDGNVVMVVQLGNSISGFGVGAEILEDKVGRFFEKAK